MAENKPEYAFTVLETSLPSLASRARSEQLLQYNLDACLSIQKLRFSGGNFTNSATLSEYEHLLKELILSDAFKSVVQPTGTPTIPVELEMDALGISIMSMDFFDRLQGSEITSVGGKLRGCFEEIYDGVSVNDLLRDLLVNENSENAHIFNEAERSEFIYQLFKLFVVGGSMCQPDHELNRYLEITRDVYKDVVTVYREAKTETVKVSGRVFSLKGVQSMDVFSNPSSPHNMLFILVDPLKKNVTLIRKDFKSFW